MRSKIVAGNWKMNKTYTDGLKLMKEVIAVNLLRGNQDVDVILCPPFIFSNICAALTESSSNVFAGAQNAASEKNGAFTGEVSSEMLNSIGIKYVIIGHSERRMYYGETNDILAKKMKLAIEARLIPIYCIGETLEQRNTNEHFNIVKEQLTVALTSITAEDMKSVILAYEPVWAIGTGVNASKEQAQEMHHFIRSVVAEMHGVEIAEDMPILYGGSCKPTNAKDLFDQPDVDGGLIGGASLDVNDFIDIINSFDSLTCDNSHNCKSCKH